jgi:succinylglutamate desuccinylase
MHGNEPAGVRALETVFDRLAAEHLSVDGWFVGLVGNRAALAAGRRFLREDLNRVWVPKRLADLEQGSAGLSDEPLEQAELATELRPLLNGSAGQTFLLDLHTTSAPGPPFVLLEDTLPNRAFALRFPVPVILGVDERLGGTLVHHACARGATAIGFEAGQHDDQVSVDRAEDAIWIALGALGLVAGSTRVDRARQRLERARSALPRYAELRHRHPVGPTDAFEMRPGFANFDAVTAGEAVATSRRGPVTAPESGLLLMPLYQQQGEDGFFLIRAVRPIWLRLSSWLRRLRAERYLHWLPGVSRHPDRPRAFVVDRHTARWRAVELFHLLGFSCVATDDGEIIVTRRRHDEVPDG